MISAYLKRTFKRPVFFISVLGVWGVCLLRFINGSLTAADVVGDLDLLVNLDAFRKVIAVFAALPFASTFAEEWKANMSFSCILRCSPKKYAWSQVLMCFLTAFLTSIMGFILFLISDSFRMPLYIPDEISSTSPFGYFLDHQMVWINLLLVSANFSISCAMWSVSGLLMSAVFPDKLIAVCTPFIASYLLERITLKFPDQFNLLYVALSRISIMGSPLLSFLYVIFLFSLITLLLGFIFVHMVEKRVKSEID